jgi:hypothetical protein
LEFGALEFGALEPGALEPGALDFGVLPGFLGLSEFFAMAQIWGDSGGEKRAKATTADAGKLNCQQMSAHDALVSLRPVDSRLTKAYWG